MKDCEIVDTNAENMGSGSFCGYKDANNLGHRRKTDWLKQDGKLIAGRPVSAARMPFDGMGIRRGERR